jgi:hypothetical protein
MCFLNWMHENRIFSQEFYHTFNLAENSRGKSFTNFQINNLGYTVSFQGISD